MLDGIYADWSCALPSEWTSSTVELVAISWSSNAGSAIENANELKGNFALLLGGTVPLWVVPSTAQEGEPTPAVPAGP